MAGLELTTERSPTSLESPEICHDPGPQAVRQLVKPAAPAPKDHFAPAPFPEPLHVGRPNIGNRERLLARINQMLDSARLTNRGPFVKELEARVADYCRVKHCIAMCNGTVALEIAIRALELKGEVILPSFTFVATAHALQWQEITPVFCDIDPVSCTLDPGRIERLVTPRTTGIIGVHVWGRTCDVDAIDHIARKHGLKVLYDAAHALGCTFHGRASGSFGDAAVLSFHATKFVNAFEGGAVLTNNDELAEKIRLMQNFGFSGYDKVIYIGTNGKMPEVCAAMALTNMESIEEFVEINRTNFDTYREALAGIPGVRLMEYDPRERNNFQYVVIEVNEAITGVSRDQLVTRLHEMNVLCRRYFFPGCHRMEPYRSYFPNAGLLLPNTEALSTRFISLPTGTGVTPSDITRIGALIRHFLGARTA